MSIALTFPGGQVKDIEITATAGNDPFPITPGDYTTYILEYVRLSLTTDGTVANRLPYLQLENSSGDRVFTSYWAGPTTAGVTYTTLFSSGFNAVGAGYGVFENFQAPIPQLIIKSDDVLSVVIYAGVAGDSYTGNIRVRAIGGA